MLNLKNFSKGINILLNRSHYINKIIVDEGHYNYSVNLKLADLVLAREWLFLRSVTLIIFVGEVIPKARSGQSGIRSKAWCIASRDACRMLCWNVNYMFNSFVVQFTNSFARLHPRRRHRPRRPQALPLFPRWNPRASRRHQLSNE